MSSQPKYIFFLSAKLTFRSLGRKWSKNRLKHQIIKTNNVLITALFDRC